MTAGPLTTILGYLRRRASQSPEEHGDGALLRCFAAGRDEEAFATLVGRHGSMVLDVCRRVLHDSHDAEDAFQATFFILARKAGAIRKGDSVASWLHGVALRVALKMKATTVRRRAHERQVVVVDQPDPAVEVARAELRPVLDEELGRLPKTYRAPLVLCYLEGKTNEQAARELGWPKGTVAGRLARARELLRGRLRRRGLALSSGLLVALLGESAAMAAVPATLAGCTIQAAGVFATGTVAAASASAPVALAEGVLQTMMLTRIKIAVVLLVVCACGTGAGVVAQRVGPTGEGVGRALPAAQDSDKDKAADEVKKLKSELLKLREELARTRAELDATKREALRQRQLAEQQRRRAEAAAAQALDALRRAQAERERAVVEAKRAEEAVRAAARAVEQTAEKKAVQLAQAWLTRLNIQWGMASAVRRASKKQADMVGGGKETYLVVFPTPAQEKQRLGERGLVVDNATGKVVPLLRN